MSNDPQLARFSLPEQFRALKSSPKTQRLWFSTLHGRNDSGLPFSFPEETNAAAEAPQRAESSCVIILVSMTTRVFSFWICQTTTAVRVHYARGSFIAGRLRYPATAKHFSDSLDFPGTEFRTRTELASVETRETGAAPGSRSQPLRGACPWPRWALLLCKHGGLHLGHSTGLQWHVAGPAVLIVLPPHPRLCFGCPPPPLPAGTCAGFASGPEKPQPGTRPSAALLWHSRPQPLVTRVSWSFCPFHWNWLVHRG